MSDDSEDEVLGRESLEELNYRRKYQMLLERCEVLQQDNERLVNRIQHAFKYTRQMKAERAHLIERLEIKHGDDWQAAINKCIIESNQPRPLRQEKPPQKKPYRRPSAAKKRSDNTESKVTRRPSKEQRTASMENN